MHLISDMLFLNNSFEDKTLKKVTSLFFYGQSVITLLNLVFILIISIMFCLDKKMYVFLSASYKVHATFRYLLILDFKITLVSHNKKICGSTNFFKSYA